MSSHETKITDNHDTIKKWVEERNGEPAVVDGVVEEGKAGEKLRIHFPGPSEEILSDISWELFFEILEENNLEFLYQEGNQEGDESKLYKIIPKK